MAKKPVTRAERLEVVYDGKHWRLLEELRSRAIQIMEALSLFHLPSIVYGSIARGDVSEESDIDVFLPNPPPSFFIETALERTDIPFNRRIVVQATPHYAVKGHIEIKPRECVSFPLLKLLPVERRFYKFGGKVSLSMLKRGVRVSGVDKRLMLIEPRPNGHVESTVLGREEEVAHLLGVSLETVLNRVRALLRRDEVGRTGVFVKRELLPEETFEMVLKKLADQNPAVRRRLRLFGK